MLQACQLNAGVSCALSLKLLQESFTEFQQCFSICCILSRGEKKITAPYFCCIFLSVIGLARILFVELLVLNLRN